LETILFKICLVLFLILKIRLFFIFRHEPQDRKVVATTMTSAPSQRWTRRSNDWPTAGWPDMVFYVGRCQLFIRLYKMFWIRVEISFRIHSTLRFHNILSDLLHHLYHSQHEKLTVHKSTICSRILWQFLVTRKNSEPQWRTRWTMFGFSAKVSALLHRKISCMTRSTRAKDSNEVPPRPSGNNLGRCFSSAADSWSTPRHSCATMWNYEVFSWLC